jgi:hypothetical protein
LLHRSLLRNLTIPQLLSFALSPLKWWDRKLKTLSSHIALARLLLERRQREREKLRM